MKRSKLLANDTNLPINDLTPERILQVEKVAMSLQEEIIENIKREKPYLLKSGSQK